MKRRTVVMGTGAVILLIVAVALVAADRIAVAAAEARIADQARAELAERGTPTGADPAVTITGFPFLTQVIDGEYQDISIEISQWEAARGVRFDRLKLVARTVRADTRSVLNGAGQVTAGTLTGIASMDWSAVRQVLEIANLPGVDLSAVQFTARDHDLVLRLPVAVMGQRATLVAQGGLIVERGTIRLAVANVTVEGGNLSPTMQHLVNSYRDRLSVTLTIPDLPYELVVNSVAIGAAGITVTATASNVAMVG